MKKLSPVYSRKRIIFVVLVMLAGLTLYKGWTFINSPPQGAILSDNSPSAPAAKVPSVAYKDFKGKLIGFKHADSYEPAAPEPPPAGILEQHILINDSSMKTRRLVVSVRSGNNYKELSAYQLRAQALDVSYAMHDFKRADTIGLTSKNSGEAISFTTIDDKYIVTAALTSSTAGEELVKELEQIVDSLVML